jgi:hypothetical protein
MGSSIERKERLQRRFSKGKKKHEIICMKTKQKNCLKKAGKLI